MKGYETACLYAWIVAKALSHSEVTGTANGQVYELPLPDDATYPCIGYSIVPLLDARNVEADPLYARFQFNVFAIDEWPTIERIVELTAAIPTIFDCEPNLPIDTNEYGNVWSCRRLQTVVMPMTDRQKRWQHSGYRFAAEVQ